MSGEADTNAEIDGLTREQLIAAREQHEAWLREYEESNSELAALSVQLREAEQREATLREALSRAAYIAEHLLQMIDRDSWRATGGDDGQGHYEGDYRQEQVDVEIRSLAALAGSGGTKCHICGWPRNEPGWICCSASHALGEGRSHVASESGGATPDAVAQAIAALSDPEPCDDFRPLHPGLIGTDCANCRFPAGAHTRSGVTDEPRYTLEEAQRKLALQECVTRGHYFSVLVEVGVDGPTGVICERCGKLWTVVPAVSSKGDK